MQRVLIVDGYNMIGSWKDLRILRDTNFEEARKQLIDVMAEYKASTGMRVMVVFDAHKVPGAEQNYNYNGVEVIYTKKSETADERIEKLTNELKSRRTQIYVATSDMLEQHVIFGNGALRISARELEIEVQNMQSKVSEQVEEKKKQMPKSRISLPKDIERELEKIRRGLKE